MSLKDYYIIMNDSEKELNSKLRSLPSVGKVLDNPALQPAIKCAGKNLFKCLLNDYLGKIREGLVSGKLVHFNYDKLIDEISFSVNSICDNSMREVINATGILLHTGLGRSALSNVAVGSITAAAKYTPVQSDPVTGKRSLRESKVEVLLKELTGAEAVTVVNNNAAATMLVLNTLAKDKEVVISRGQLVEIGGAFRMPDVMTMSGAIMKEIGTTNRTHLSDYRNAFDENVGALMHVHTSNYRLRGFGGTPDISEIVSLAKELGLYSIDDLGSGALVSLEKWGVESEPLIKDSITAGVDLCCFSGDKLIGGAQSGIICGKYEHIEKIRKNPFARMFRVDKLTLAALEATLAIWVNGEYEEKIPLYKMLCTSKQILKNRAMELSSKISGKIFAEISIEESEAYIGSGSLPDSGIKSWAVSLKFKNIEAEQGAQILRKNGVFSRVRAGRVWLDMISLLDGHFDLLVHRIISSFGK